MSETDGRRSTVIVGTAVAIAVIALGFVVFLSADRSAPITEVTDPDTLRSAVALSHISIATSENFAGQRVRVISGSMKNTSDKSLRLIVLKLTFLNYAGGSIQEGVHKAFKESTKPLSPEGEARFVLRFENLPKDWNYRIPTVEVAKIGY